MSRPDVHLLELFAPVVLPAGHQVGMGRLKAATDGVIGAISEDDSGRPIYRVSFTTKGKERSTWLSSSEAHAFHEAARPRR